MARNRKKKPNLGRKIKHYNGNEEIDLYKCNTKKEMINKEKKEVYFSCLYKIRFIENTLCTIGKYIYCNEDNYYSCIFEENEEYEAFVDNSRGGYCFDYEIKDYGHDKYGYSITMFVPFEKVIAKKIIKKIL